MADNKHIDSNYPEDSIGALMHHDFISVDKDWTVGETIDFLRNQSDEYEDFYDVFVMQNNTPIASVPISRILLRERDVKIADIMVSINNIIDSDTDQEDVLHEFQTKGLTSAPVVDADNQVVGVVTIDDIADIAQEEAEEDLLLMAGVGEESDINETAVDTAKNRFLWLFVNLLTAIIASLVISRFEVEIEKLVALAVLMPIVASMAGNAGMQTLTVAVRAIATHQLDADNSRQMIKKEILSSLVNGVVFAIIVFFASYGYYNSASLSFAFAISIILSLIIAAASGALTPLFLKRIGIDPAIASSVILTTITDVAGFFIFLFTASLFVL